MLDENCKEKAGVSHNLHFILMNFCFGNCSEGTSADVIVSQDSMSESDDGNV